MKYLRGLWISAVLVIGALLVAFTISLDSHATTPSLMTVQGKLTNPAGTPVPPGAKNFQFKIFDAQSGGTERWPAPGPAELQSVNTDANGLWTAQLGEDSPLSDAVFAATERWLEITVAGEALSRIKLNTTAYSHRVSTVDGSVGGEISSKVSIGPGHLNTGLHGFVAGSINAVTGDYACVGGGVSNRADALLATVGGGDNNHATGESSTIGGGSFNRVRGAYATVAGGGGPLVDDSNSAMGNGSTVSGGQRNTADGHVSTIGGGSMNIAEGIYSTVGGGISNWANEEGINDGATIGGGGANSASGEFATISGGSQNRAGGQYATVGGGGGPLPGDSNAANGGWSTVGGGSWNHARADYATVGGGYYNWSSLNADYSTVGGGWNNIANGSYSTIGGGFQSSAGGAYATVPGGKSNLALVDYTLAAGTGSVADDVGAVVISANTDDATSTRSGVQEQMVLRADGYFYFTGGTGANITAPDGFSTGMFINTNAGSPGAHLTDAGVWTNASNAENKENYTVIDREELLEKIAALSITRWNYKVDQDDVQHIGPTAQDFYALFELGGDDKCISTIDPSGIALAAIQALNEKLNEQKAENDELHQQIAELREMICAQAIQSK